MTATQILERIATSMMVAAYGEEGMQQMQTPPSKAGGILARMTAQSADADMEEDDVPVARLLELPTVMLEHMCSFLDHASMHAVETTSVTLYNVTKHSGACFADCEDGDERATDADVLVDCLLTVDLWMELARQHLVVGDESRAQHSWKEMLCLSSGGCDEDGDLIGGVKAFSSADRPSETPENTLKPSRCWHEINNFKRPESLNSIQEINTVPTFMVTLGERIQMQCGCSSGNSCYWSSSASSNKNAADYIDYVIDGPSVISSVEILPYRVFWHPGSPTYGPQQMMVEFYELVDDDMLGDDPEGKMVATASKIEPFYQSPVYSVKNEMELQEFKLPLRVWTSGSSIMRIRLLGRHQAQTFVLPLWMQHTDEDRLPKYYCCLSYVKAVGLSRDWLPTPGANAPRRRRKTSDFHNQNESKPSSLGEMMAAYFETMMEQRRIVQRLRSLSS